MKKKLKESIHLFFLTNKTVLLLILTAFLVRFYFLTIALSMQGLDSLVNATPDSINYLKMAHWLLGADIPYPEGRFFDWGIGHASWLAGILYLFKNPFAIFIIQIILSSISCGIIYKLSLELLDNKIIAIVASLLLIFSATSINLSILILSDTLYFFLMIFGLYNFIIGMRTNRWKYFIIAGCSTGYAVLVKSIGQFWVVPLMIIFGLFIFIKLPRFKLTEIYQKHKSLIIKLISTICLIILIMSTSIISNYNRYGIPTMAFTSAGGPANVAAWTTGRLAEKDFREVKKEWYEEYKLKENLTHLTLKDQYILLRENAMRVFKENPSGFIHIYFSNVWKNMNTLNYLPRATFPSIANRLISFEEFLKRNSLQYLNFILSILGLLILFFTKRYYTGFILLLIYFYYAVLMGSSLWQGTRLFYPAQIAAVILMSITFYSVFSWFKTMYEVLFTKWIRPYRSSK